MRLAALAMIAGSAISVRAMQPASAPPDPAAFVSVLNDAQSTESQRRFSASELIRLSDSVAVRDMIVPLLREPLHDNSTSDLLVDAMETSPRLTLRLFQPVIARLSGATNSEIPRLLNVLARFRTRESVRYISSYLRHPDEQVLRAAVESLSSISGRDDLPQSANAWISWSARVDRMSELQWREELIGALASKTDRLEAERQSSVGRLSASLRQLYLATDPVQRSSLLAEWLGDPLAEVRDLGIELARRELGSSTKLDPSVGAAALRLLDSDAPSVRARAAVLVRQLAPEGAPTAISAAILSENDPEAAGALLLAAARWPDKAIIPAALAWFSRETSARDAAVEACNALTRAALMTEEQRRITLDLARMLIAKSPTSALISLLWSIGDSTDSDLIAPFLASENPALRFAAAECLMWSEDHAQSVIEAAATHPDLFEPAAKAAFVHAHDSAGFAAIAHLQAPSRDIRDAALIRLGSAIPADQLAAVLRELEDGPAARALRLNLVSGERLLAEANEPASLAAITNGMLRLAEEDLSAGKPDAALARLEPMPTTAPSDVLDATRRLQLLSYIVLGRLELAEQDATADLPLWIRGLQMITGKEHEEETIRRIESRFGDRIDEASAATLASAKDRIAKARAPQ